ncbi:hypothetical protein [Ferruginibacter sp.]
MSAKPLNILVLGCLGPNQNRISSLAKTVNRVIYAYTEFNPSQILLDDIIQVAIPRRNMSAFIEYISIRYEINVIYSLLNSHDESTEATIELIESGLKIPIIRHYKEHPCFPTVEEKKVLTETAGQIYINQESFNYFHSVYGVDKSTAHYLDADMISKQYMTDNFQSKLSAEDGKPHLLIAGSMSALNDRLDVRELCSEMDKRNICVHLYGNMVSENSEGYQIFYDKATALEYQKLTTTLKNTTLHSFITPEMFAFEWSKYDAGFMHSSVPSSHPTSQFEELNMPYRYTAYLCAGLPICIPSVGQSAMKRFVGENKIGFSFKDYDELSNILHDRTLLKTSEKRIRERRTDFSFEFSVNKLIDILSKYSL